MRLPIRLRLTGWYVLLLAVVLAGVGAFAVIRLRSDLGGEIDRSLGHAATPIAYGYQAEGRNDFLDVASTVFPALPAGPGAAQVLDSHGRVIVGYGTVARTRPIIGGGNLATVLGGKRLRTTVSVGRGQRFRVLAVPVRRDGKRQVLALAKSLRNRDRSVHRLLVLLLIAFPVALLAAAAGGWLLARRALRPVEEMTSRADRIRVDRLADRIPVPPTRDEIAHLGATLNAMLERLQRGVQDKERLVAHTSHELRTPLSAMQAELDVSLRYDDLSPPTRELLASTREEVERMSVLVGNLLTLASIDEGRLELREEHVELGELVRRVARNLDPLASAAGVDLEVEHAPAALVGDEGRLREVAGNLLVNAIKFAGRGGRVRISTWQRDGEAGFVVSDNGPGLSREAHDHVFERFWRGEESRSRDGGGSGLGLAICQEIVEAHGGRVWVESDVGQGAHFRVALPVRAPASSRQS